MGQIPLGHDRLRVGVSLGSKNCGRILPRQLCQCYACLFAGGCAAFL